MAGSIEKRPRVKFGGDAYLAGDFMLLLVGGIGHSWNEIAAALIFIITAFMVSHRGDDDAWFAAACGPCIPAIILTNLRELSAGSFPTIVGTILYSVAELLGMASQPLAQVFAGSKSKVMRRTLGAPRLWMGILSFNSRLFMLVDALMHRQWGMLTVLLLWSIGDGLAGLSIVKVKP